jgi:hypothetical protein
VLDKLMEILGRLRTKKVILLIGDENLARRLDVVFIDPRGSPDSLLSETYLSLWEQIHATEVNMSWDSFARAHNTCLREEFGNALQVRLDWRGGKS